MSSFFTFPSQKKRKRPPAPDLPKKRIAAFKPNGKSPSTRKTSAPPRQQEPRDESISGSESSASDASEDEDVRNAAEESDSGKEVETAAERRLRLAERYLENVRAEVDEVGFDAEEIDRDLIAERLKEDVAEIKGKVFRSLASELAFEKASHTMFRQNTESFTSVAAHAPYVYTTTKDLYLHKWRIQDLPEKQFPQTTKKKSKKRPAPPRKQPDLKTWLQGSIKRVKDKEYRRHVGQILCVAVSPDGKYVCTGGADRRLIVYDAESLKPLRVFTHHRDAVTGLAFRRGTNQLYSCSKDRTVKVWSLNELAYLDTLYGHADHCMDIAADAFTQERCVSVGARDRTARLWKVQEESQLVFRGGAIDKRSRPGVDPRSLAHEGSMDRVCLLDDTLFVTGSDNGSLALWTIQKKKPVFVLPIAHGLDPAPAPADISPEAIPDEADVPIPVPRPITALRAVPYSDLILSGSWDGYIRAWKLSTDKKRIEPAGVLGAVLSDDAEGEGKGMQAPAQQVNGDSHNTDGAPRRENPWLIKGVVNDLAIFERGEKGLDGLCVVAAVGKEHRLGRWKKVQGGRNGGVVFEVARIPREITNGVHEGTAGDETDEEKLD